jgi:hypothetical protein
MKRNILKIALTATIIFTGAGAGVATLSAQDDSYMMLNGSLYDFVFSWKHKKPWARESHWLLAAGFRLRHSAELTPPFGYRSMI